MIIKCPSCERRFDLQRKAPTTFHCPKCGYSAPFRNIIEAEKTTDVLFSSDEAVRNTAVDSISTEAPKTKLVSELQQDNFSNEKTKVVSGLQPRSGATLQIMDGGRPIRTVSVVPGHHTLGRQSSDSKATIKIAPDINMSRIHAYLSSIQGSGGGLQFILKPANQNNPVYINNRAVVYGTAALLRPGDVIVMGNTMLMFKM